MNALTKVLVIDDGRRGAADLLSTGLAELGLSSVTASVEAARDVLEVIERPSAIFLNMPADRGGSEHASFAQLASSLRSLSGMSGIPVIEWDRAAVMAPGAISAILRSEVGPQAVVGPEL